MRRIDLAPTLKLEIFPDSHAAFNEAFYICIASEIHLPKVSKSIKRHDYSPKSSREGLKSLP